MIELPDEVAGVHNPPVRYQSNSDAIEDVFTVIDMYDLSYYEGHALKYLVRLDKKGSDESNLGKARHFLLESERRATVEVPWWMVGTRSVGIPEILAAFDIRENVRPVVTSLLMSKVDNEPRYWLRKAGAQLDGILAM